MTTQVILITGASSGIGYQTAKDMAQQGHRVYGTTRQLEKMKNLPAVIPLEMDMRDSDSMKRAVEVVIQAEGKIDGLINNAGYGSFGAVEDVSISEAKKQFDVNLFGLARLIQLVLPYMRAEGSGRIINISSMGGRLTTYMGAWYHGTKYALEAFSDALRMEVRPFGIEVVLIEPGGIKTEWGDRAASHLEVASKGGSYEEQSEKAALKMRQLYGSNYVSSPELIAKTIIKAISKKKPKPRYLVGFGAKPAVFLHAVLPSRLFDWLVVSIFAGQKGR